MTRELQEEMRAAIKSRLDQLRAKNVDAGEAVKIVKLEMGATYGVSPAMALLIAQIILDVLKLWKENKDAK